jgi:DNA/RNA endonuclease YhcR with UshA esterase domain
MRFCALVVVLLLAPALLADEKKDDKPLTPTEAAKKVDEKCVVEMEVKSSHAGKVVVFLNSEENFKDAKNFTVFIGRTGLDKFARAKIDDPATHFKGKTIRVSGTVKLYMNRPEIVVSDPEQIQVVDTKKE